MSCFLRPQSWFRFNPALHLISFSLFSVLCLAIPAHAADEITPEAVAQLELRASHANPREQCFLYTELVHTMTEQAGKEIAAGDTEKASATLKQVSRYAQLIQTTLARDAKRLKDAEELMHNSTYRLAQYLHLVSGDDQKNVRETLKQLDQVNDQMLNQVFTR